MDYEKEKHSHVYFLMLPFGTGTNGTIYIESTQILGYTDDLDIIGSV